MARAVLECKPDGRWYEIGDDGSECLWGRVLEWNPPHKMVLAWQLNGEWKYDPNFLTEVEVSFTIISAKQTRVTLIHRNLERFGVHADAVQTSFESPHGWGGILARFQEIAQDKNSDK